MTTTVKHSPTPWEFSADDKLNSQRAFGIVRSLPEGESQEPGHTEVVAEVCDGPTAEADARLIAAAPDLLAACKALMLAEGMQSGKRDGGTMGLISSAIDSARAAIRKAGGEA